MMQFAHIYLLGLAVVVIPLIWLYVKRQRQGFPTVPYPTVNVIQKISAGSFKPMLRHVPFATKILALLLLAIVIARPQSVSTGQDVNSEGIDIILAIDISGSMRAQDFKPDRAEAAKRVAAEFIELRPNDRIGVVLFAKQAFTQCPMTIDHSILLELIEGIQVGLVDPDNTAIGQALGVSLNRLKATESKSRVVILLTDGENNYGQPPTTLAEAAQAMGVRVYTIGVGTKGTAPYPAVDMFGRTRYQQVKVSIDEDLLTEIANATGGKYFRATDDSKLKAIFREIDKMEKTKVEVRAFRRYAELFYQWAIWALISLSFGWLLSVVVLRRLS